MIYHVQYVVGEEIKEWGGEEAYIMIKRIRFLCGQ